MDSGRWIVQRSTEKEHILLYKLLYSLIVLCVYIVGRSIPLYGIDISGYRHVSFNAEDLLLQTIGGDFYRSSVFALGIFPPMISALLVQVCMAIRGLFVKTGVPPGKTRRITVTVTLAIASFQAMVQVPGLQFAASEQILPIVRAIAVLEMVTGAMLLLWMSDRNTRFGIGGRTIFIIVNISERIFSTIWAHDLQSLKIPLLVSALEMAIILFMENMEKRIPVQRISIHNIYADKNYMAVKFNPAGIMPVMFSTAVFMLPRLLVIWLGSLFPYHQGILWCQENMSLTKPFGVAVYLACEYLLTIGFSMLMISPKDITEQFLKSGDSIVDLHAGRDTRRYLRRVMWCLSLFSATVMGACIAFPLFLQIQGEIDSTLVMLPTSMMMFVGIACNFCREVHTLWSYDACRPLF